MSDITLQQLQSMIRGDDGAARAAQWLAPLNAAMRACAIDTLLRQAAFLAQVLVESNGLRAREEALNYRPERLRAVWPSHFHDEADVLRCAHHPEVLANHVYAGRMGNGDEASGDGWRYRGRGLIELTGRENYARFSRASGLDALAQPDLLLQPDGAARSAAWFWQDHQLNEAADATGGADGAARFDAISRRVNGGAIGLDERRACWMRTRQALGLP